MSHIMQLHKPHFIRDVLLIAFSIALAVVIAENDLIEKIAVGNFVPAEAFIAGFFFTSLLTITPAGVAFVELAQSASMFQLAAWGAAGAALGDVLLFLFVRDAVSDDVARLFRGPLNKKVKAIFKSPFLSWAVPVCGALVIASPLPDEFGIAMLGLSKSDLRFFIPISYAMNFLGIFLIAWSVQAL